MVDTFNCYVARDENGALCYYSHKPFRSINDVDTGIWLNEKGIYGFLPSKMFPEITWDDEPRKVEISIKLL